MTQSPCRVKRTKRIFPTKAPQQPTTTKLSTLDASVARFAACSAIWLYDRTEDIDAHDPTVSERLEDALGRTLDDYPHFSGQLRWASKDDVENDINPRYIGRPIITYGAPEDPGVELVVAEDTRELSAVVPSQEERLTTKQIWNATDFPQNDFQPKTELAFSDLTRFKGLPGVAIQLTAFKCGGYAVSIKLTHCLSDAMCLMQFTHAWAAQSRPLFQKAQTGAEERIVPLLDPSRLDQYGNITATPDPAKVKKARALPMHRYNWWTQDTPGYPSWAEVSTNGTKPPAEELAKLELSPSTFPPWQTWDMAAPVEHVQIRFPASAVAAMKKAAEASLPESLKTQRISRLDSVLAHLWILINRARRHENTPDDVYMNITLGVRGRVDPPLPDTFAGSPILLGYIAKSGSEATGTTIGDVAGSIRATMARFTPDAVGAYIHDAAYEVSPQRLWQAFLGSRHVLVTSWVRARAYEVDFCAVGGLARYVQGVMPRMDGLVQVVDVGGTGDLDVSVCLERETMRRFLGDGMLGVYGI
ncbi:transferase family protein [Annulohypoxylon maeteangense]|uniref:transferase family protein n=1 Tax=Annulohypoxylon maeteangense TaxID=1927788 RepID=UPI0020083672|nr:transferase family protein [Annulohypoxylon maeteangense]KAI0888391.1 transferase family protein [Annulohypoxylon maeteangense]